MARMIPTCCSRSPAACVLALLAGFVLAPGQARAECGDYLMVGGAHETAEPAPKQVSPEAPLSPKPCRGPNCSHRPHAPALPPAPAPTVTTAEWACVVAALVDLPNTLSARTADTAEPRPFRHADPIFHPPRTAA